MELFTYLDHMERIFMLFFLMLYTAEKGKRKPEIYTLHKLYKQLLMKIK